MKVIVIGTNHAGTTAVKILKRKFPHHEVVTYDQNDNISFLGCGIALWVGGEFHDPSGLFYSSEAELKGRGIIVKMKHRVTDFDFKNQKITVLNLQNNEVLHDSYDKLIVATGSWPIIPNNIPGINLDGIYLSKLFQHAKTIIDKIRSKNVKRIAVIGAGYIGVELAEAFHKHHKEVILIDAESRIMNRYYDEEFTDSVENKMKEAGIKLQLNEKLISFKGDDGKLSHVVTDKQEYEVDLAILAIGFKPNTSLVQDKLTTDKRGAIIVDDYFQTSQKNVYAIGDCITIRDNARNKNVNIALATNAIRSGIVAALNAGSEINKYQFSGVQGTNGICVFNEKMVSTGLSETAARVVDSGYKNIKSMYFSDNDRPEFMKENFPVKIKIVWNEDDNRLLGAQISSVANHSEAIFLFSLAIQKQMTIEELALTDLFFLPHFNKPYNYITTVALKALKLID